MATKSRSSTAPRKTGATLAVALLANVLPAQSQEADPAVEAMIFRAYPEADSFMRIERNVDAQARAEVERQLPFKVHFNELGPHTLFVAFRARRPIGLVYLRSEEAEWGLAEIAWSVSLDLRVYGFQFLHGRSRHLEALENSAFAKNLVDQDFADIVEKLRSDLDANKGVPPGAETLAKTVLRSCAKALLVTKTVWSEEVAKLQDQAIGFAAFATAARFTRRVGRFDLRVGNAHQDVAVKLIYAHGTGTTRLGTVIRTDAKIGDDPLVLCWILDPDRRIVRLGPVRAGDNPSVAIACTELEGHLLSDLPTAPNPLLPLARGVGALMQQLESARAVR